MAPTATRGQSVTPAMNFPILYTRIDSFKDHAHNVNAG